MRLFILKLVYTGATEILSAGAEALNAADMPRILLCMPSHFNAKLFAVKVPRSKDSRNCPLMVS
ncbi:MAG: hypothetical protein FWH23_02450 [Bacteroidales bacterium]|nr:hypothetical protein [Bacteroidales bacterium]